MAFVTRDWVAIYESDRWELAPTLGEGLAGAGPTGAGAVASGGRVWGDGIGPSVQGHGDPPGVRGAQRIGREGKLCSHAPSTTTLWTTARPQRCPSARASSPSVGGDTRGTRTRGASHLPRPSTAHFSPSATPLAVSPAPVVELRLRESEPGTDSQKPVGRGPSVGRPVLPARLGPGVHSHPEAAVPNSRKRPALKGDGGRCVGPGRAGALRPALRSVPPPPWPGLRFPGGVAVAAHAHFRRRPRARVQAVGGVGGSAAAVGAGRGGVGRGPLDAGRTRGGWGERPHSPRRHAAGGECGQGCAGPRAGVPTAALRSPHKARGGPRPDCGDPGCLRPPWPGKAAREEWLPIQRPARSVDRGA